VVDRSQSQLLLKVSDLDDDLTDRLLMAKERGVDVRVVWASGAPLDEYQVQRVLALTDSGVDLKVTNQSQIPERTGVADGVAFAASKADPVVPEKPPAFDSDAAHASERAQRFDRELMDSVTGTDRGLLPAGQVKLHTFPDENAGVIINAIRSAKTAIDLEVYQLTDRGVIDALTEAAKRGVKVRVMVEPRALEPSNFDALGKTLKAAGIELRATPAAFDHNKNVDHAKFMVVDRQELLFGTGNLVRVGLGGNEHREANTRDFWVEDTRPAPLQEAQTLFDADWDQKPTDASMFPTLTVTPDDVASNLKALLSSATKRVWVTNQALYDANTLAELIDAKKRGCDVKVLLGAFQDSPDKAPSNEAAVQQLKAAGIEVKYLTNMYLHAKAIVADDRAFVGSQNFTGGGLVRNREVGAIYDDKDLVAGMVSAFNADWANPGQQPVVPPSAPARAKAAAPAA
jgi:phosphatidylserine/phosphatidylglycerophosphate/cardiolipin synthase-like enzyme